MPENHTTTADFENNLSDFDDSAFESPIPSPFTNKIKLTIKDPSGNIVYQSESSDDEVSFNPNSTKIMEDNNNGKMLLRSPKIMKSQDKLSCSLRSTEVIKQSVNKKLSCTLRSPRLIESVKTSVKSPKTLYKHDYQIRSHSPIKKEVEKTSVKSPFKRKASETFETSENHSPAKRKTGQHFNSIDELSSKQNVPQQDSTNDKIRPRRHSDRLSTSTQNIKSPNEIKNRTYKSTGNEVLINPDNNQTGKEKHSVKKAASIISSTTKHANSLDHQYYECHLCQKLSRTKINGVLHLISHTESKRFHCYLCQKSFNIQKKMLRHFLRDHSMHSKVKSSCRLNIKMLMSEHGFVQCSTCKKLLLSKDYLSKHICKDNNNQNNNSSKLIKHPISQKSTNQDTTVTRSMDKHVDKLIVDQADSKSSISNIQKKVKNNTEVGSINCIITKTPVIEICNVSQRTTDMESLKLNSTKHLNLITEDETLKSNVANTVEVKVPKKISKDNEKIKNKYLECNLANDIDLNVCKKKKKSFKSVLNENSSPNGTTILKKSNKNINLETEKQAVKSTLDEYTNNNSAFKSCTNCSLSLKTESCLSNTDLLCKICSNKVDNPKTVLLSKQEASETSPPITYEDSIFHVKTNSVIPIKTETKQDYMKVTTYLCEHCPKSFYRQSKLLSHYKYCLKKIVSIDKTAKSKTCIVKPMDCEETGVEIKGMACLEKSEESISENEMHELDTEILKLVIDQKKCLSPTCIRVKVITSGNDKKDAEEIVNIPKSVLNPVAKFSKISSANNNDIVIKQQEKRKTTLKDSKSELKKQRFWFGNGGTELKVKESNSFIENLLLSTTNTKKTKCKSKTKPSALKKQKTQVIEQPPPVSVEKDIPNENIFNFSNIVSPDQNSVIPQEKPEMSKVEKTLYLEALKIQIDDSFPTQGTIKNGYHKIKSSKSKFELTTSIPNNKHGKSKDNIFERNAFDFMSDYK